MTTNNLRLCPTNFFDLATLVESPAMQSGMPATNAQLTARDKTARSTASQGTMQTIKGAWSGSAYKFDSFFVFRHNGHSGNVRLRLYTNSDYTTTAYDSGTVALGAAITSNSYDFGTPSDANDPLLSESPYSLFFTATTAKSFQIDYSAGALSYWDIGRDFLGKYIELPFNPLEGMTVTENYNDIQQRTKGGSLRTRAGEKWRDLTIDTRMLQDYDRALWRDVISIIQMNQDVAISVFPGVGGRQERDYVFNAQLQAPSAFAMSTNITSAQHKFTEV